MPKLEEFHLTVDLIDDYVPSEYDALPIMIQELGNLHEALPEHCRKRVYTLSPVTAPSCLARHLHVIRRLTEGATLRLDVTCAESPFYLASTWDQMEKRQEVLDIDILRNAFDLGKLAFIQFLELHLGSNTVGNVHAKGELHLPELKELQINLGTDMRDWFPFVAHQLLTSMHTPKLSLLRICDASDSADYLSQHLFRLLVICLPKWPRLTSIEIDSEYYRPQNLVDENLLAFINACKDIGVELIFEDGSPQRENSDDPDVLDDPDDPDDPDGLYTDSEDIYGLGDIMNAEADAIALGAGAWDEEYDDEYW